jgi:NADPH-dependent glutamate synthase beta subunit-like oxidoreductase/NAD-dependent dihydropyrimidine dehydrogenase PreA subunit
MARGVAILGSSAGAAQAALTLAELGFGVSIFTPSASLDVDSALDGTDLAAPDKRLGVWPLLLRAASHPLVTIHTNCDVDDVTGKRGRFTVRAIRSPRFVREDLCTGCNRCADACSVQLPHVLDGRRGTHSAIHPPLPDKKSVPTAFCIDKTGIAPCRAACPLGINVQGFVSLISKGKADEALDLINETAPLAGVLGRVCTHPCQEKCKRDEIDAPVFTPALHRFAADNASAIRYKRKAPERSRREKIAIVGSGPAGLAAAWELALRGYSPTIFESHAVVGGMVATGIPRFRLPHEVREQEVEAIRRLGVDIKTGVTVGRDVTISDLRERDYRAFFIAIGAHLNRSLGIPGEDLEGVVDAVSLLFALNLKVGASVGSNVVVIGGGNSAVDSARTAKRRSKGDVRILYRRTEEEMTAVAEEVVEAVNEGVTIEYLTQPVEVLGEAGRVTGLRCQRMRLGEVEADGRRRPEPIPGSEYVIEADHVVMAIGQRPNSATLRMRGLAIDSDEATIEADPLTLETSMAGVFAGGDCVTGPNNVVDAVAAGLRAAASIDRYLRGRDLRKGRSPEAPKPVEVDVRDREASSHKRARMPTIPPHKRVNRFEEVALGLPVDTGRQEAERCLNCALCSECLQCEQVCEVGAVLHGDTPEQVDVPASVVIDFAGVTSEDAKPGVYVAASAADGTLDQELALASALALDVAAELNRSDDTRSIRHEAARAALPDRDRRPEDEAPVAAGPDRIGVVLCRCSGSISSVVDFDQMTDEVQQLPGVASVQETSQACSEEAAAYIVGDAAQRKLDRVVLAACRCCGLDQICFSCSDRRIACQQNLSATFNRDRGGAVEFANIREHCAWVHGDDPSGATRKAVEIVSAAVARARQGTRPASEERPVAGSALILGAGPSGLVAARSLVDLGLSAVIVSGPGSPPFTEASSRHQEYRDGLISQLEERGVHVVPWPRRVDLRGSPGCYEATLRAESQQDSIEAGAVVIDVGHGEGQLPPDADVISRESLLGRILARMGREEGEDAYAADLRQVAIRETAGVFVIAADADEPAEQQALKGAAAAARASEYLSHVALRPRGAAVIVNSKLCRGCGNCAAICSYVELEERDSGIACARVDRALCLGCGACVAHCPTGALSRPEESDGQIGSALEALLGRVPA